MLPEWEFVFDSLGSEVWEGVVDDEWELSAEGSPRRRRLNMESRRDCGWWSVDVRESLEIGAGGEEVKSSARTVPGESVDDSLWKGLES